MRVNRTTSLLAAALACAFAATMARADEMLRVGKAVPDTLAKSWVELKILPQEPDLKTLYTDAFLPAPAK